MLTVHYYTKAKVGTMFWLLIILAVAQLSDSSFLSYKNYSYHLNVGIPAARRRLEIEKRIVERAGGINSRIIGGYQANHENYPWLVK